MDQQSECSKPPRLSQARAGAAGGCIVWLARLMTLGESVSGNDHDRSPSTWGEQWLVEASLPDAVTTIELLRRATIIWLERLENIIGMWNIIGQPR